MKAIKGTTTINIDLHKYGILFLSRKGLLVKLAAKHEGPGHGPGLGLARYTFVVSICVYIYINEYHTSVSCIWMSIHIYITLHS